MSPITDSDPLADVPGRQNLLDEPEHASLLRMTRLVEHLFRVPIAYMALLGTDLTVVTRIGSGSEHWGFLTTYPLAELLAIPRWWPDLSGFPAAGFIGAEIKFAASAPLRSSEGLDLGLLVIADVQLRPDFSREDHETLVELAGVLSGKMELRMMASQAREMELSRQEAERRFRGIANAVPLLIVYTGVDGTRSFVNDTLLEFTGRTLQEEVGDGFADPFHPDYREAVVAAYWDAFQERRPLAIEFPMRRHDGEYRWMLARGNPRFLANGTYAGYTGCFVDMTDQRSVVLELQKQNRCAAAVAEAAGAFYLILDAEGRIQQASPLCRPTSGPGPMRGRFLWEACDAAVPGGAAIRDAIRRAASGRATVQIRTAYLPVPGGGAAELLWSFTPVLSDENELIAVAATAFELSGTRRSKAA